MAASYFLFVKTTKGMERFSCFQCPENCLLTFLLTKPG